VDVGDAADRTHLFEQLVFPRRFQPLLELEGPVEMILNRPFAVAGDDEDLVDSGGGRFFYDVLDHRLVHQRNQFFRDRFGERQETGSESRRRDDRLADFLHRAHPVPTISGLMTLIPSCLRTRISSPYIRSFS